MNWIVEHILTVVTFFPLIVGALLLVIPSGKKGCLWGVGLAGSLLEFLFSLHPYVHFKNTGSFEFLETHAWIPQWKIQYLMGIDGVSLLLILLTTLLTPIVILASWESIQKNIKGFLVSLLVLETGMIGVFCALDLILFYVFWEIMLIPMYFIIGIWGLQRKIYAAIKFFLYTMAGSVLMLVAILALYFHAGQTFNLFELYETRVFYSVQFWAFLAFGLAFAIKVPLFPFHTWLPDAHVEAPTGGSVILAGVLLKMGVYGFFRFAIPLFPDALQVLQPYLIALSVIGIVYGALVAMVQTDIKKLVAYSSVSHMGVVMLGIFSMQEVAIQGGLYQMLCHGISTGGLFLLVGALYERSHSRAISDHSGLAKIAPVFTTIFLIVSLSSMGLPLTNGFVGEFLSFAGAFKVYPVVTGIGLTAVILSAFYLLWLIERICFGEARVLGRKDFKFDLNLREVLMFVPILILIFWMGIYPKPFLEKIERPVENLLLQLELGNPEVTKNGF